VGRVEGERPRLELLHREAVVRAGVLLAVAALLERSLLAVASRRRDDDDALAEPQRGLDGVGEPRRVRVRDRVAGGRIDGTSVGTELGTLGRVRVPDDVPVDDDLDGVPLVPVELRDVRQVVHLAVDPDADEALPPGGLEDAVALGLAILDERAEDEQPGALGQREHLVHDLLHALALDGMAGRTVRLAHAREQQPQVVVDLRDGPDRRARVARRALLVDGDRRRQAVDLVDVRLLHLAEKLAGVGGETLDVATLALGVDRVEGEAALAASGQPRDDDEPVPRERDGDVLEVVFAGTANDELVLGHFPFSLPDVPETVQVFYVAPTVTPSRSATSRSPGRRARRHRSPGSD
jgi:hypothetical protein